MLEAIAIVDTFVIQWLGMSVERYKLIAPTKIQVEALRTTRGASDVDKICEE